LKKRLLFVGPIENSDRIYGAKIDFDILNKNFKVKIINVLKRKRFISLFIDICKKVIWADIIFSWFINEKVLIISILSKIFRKKSIIVPSGYSVAYVPKLKYGQVIYFKGRLLTKLSLHITDKILAVSKYNLKEIMNYMHNSKIELIYHGVDAKIFRPEKIQKDKLVITVGIIKSSNLKRKGLETFVKAASYLPNINFILIGPHKDKSIKYLKSFATSNVKFTGFISNSSLLKYMQKAKVYVQVSAHEAFGLSLAEAMLCKCVPVVTEQAALSEVVGETGFYVPYDDSKATAEAIKRALISNKGNCARCRIKSMFSIEKRENKLVEVIKCLLKSEVTLTRVNAR